MFNSFSKLPEFLQPRLPQYSTRAMLETGGDRPLTAEEKVAKEFKKAVARTLGAEEVSIIWFAVGLGETSGRHGTPSVTWVSAHISPKEVRDMNRVSRFVQTCTLPIELSQSNQGLLSSVTLRMRVPEMNMSQLRTRVEEMCRVLLNK